MRWTRLWLCVLACSPLLPQQASAYEDRVGIGLSVGYAGAIGDDLVPDHGLLLTASLSYGINDKWSLGGHVDYGLHKGDDSANVGIVGAELVYTLDVVRFVPFAGAGLDLFWIGQDGRREADFGINLLLGVDYFINKRWIVGVDVRPYWLPFELSDLDPVYFTASLRATFLIERF